MKGSPHCGVGSASLFWNGLVTYIGGGVPHVPDHLL